VPSPPALIHGPVPPDRGLYDLRVPPVNVAGIEGNAPSGRDLGSNVSRGHRARWSVVTLTAVVALSIAVAPSTPAGAHQWRRAHGSYVARVADADAHLWTVRLVVERTRSGTAEITTRCVVEISRVKFERTVTIPEGEPSVNVRLGRLVRFPRHDPPDPDDVEIGDAKHCHRL
jgi:hypothetical protein